MLPVLVESDVIASHNCVTVRRTYWFETEEKMLAFAREQQGILVTEHEMQGLDYEVQTLHNEGQVKNGD